MIARRLEREHGVQPTLAVKGMLRLIHYQHHHLPTHLMQHRKRLGQRGTGGQLRPSEIPA
ncbi:hypothetical protein D3C80_2062490 [compost metagenome]